MTRDRATDAATVGLGAVYVLAGIAETTRVVVTGDGGLVGLPATAWTLLVPLVALTVVVLTLQRTARDVTR